MTSGHGVHRDLAWALKQQAQRAGEQAPSVRGADWRLATVTTVGAGTVTADGIVCRCLASYAAPTVGDVAVISQSSSGNWIALNRLASSGTPLFTPVYRYKPADTPRATATLSDDPDLTCPLDAGAVYRVEFTLHYAAIDLVSGSPAGRFRTQWTVPAGTTGFRSAAGADQGQILSGTAGGQGRWGVHQFGTACTYGDRNDNTLLCVAVEESTVFTTTAGTVALQWAQAVTNATPTFLAQGSVLRVTRIG
ncbi:hypothetical protein GCM10010317_076710 [Streptomyces mirabilis]|uniref:hypothetical protein n=1 Tax=Streptomyces mirabilis TaxID=68239 RepID=UPI00167D8D36|nr:hypothetical protein [Streptomyces mirabilis]GHD70111.1 hypothetical protein GCM10010317_076710 [Streptomyces mirabilis]